MNQQDFPHAFLLNARFPLNSISKGIVIQSNRHKNYSLVRLTPEKGGNDTDSELEAYYTTTIGRINKYLRVGTEDLFQVVFEDVGKNFAFLNQGYTVSGDLAVIMPYNKRGLISKKIRDKEERDRLQKVISKVSTNEFGILIRTAAKYASEIEILREIQKLREKYLDIESRINQADTTIGMIKSDHVSMDFLFPSITKEKLDRMRCETVPTLKLHHSIKSASHSSHRFQTKVLNLVEKIMLELQTKEFNDEVNNKFVSFYYNNLFRPKQFVNIYHNKINGRNFTLKPGIIKKIERDRSRPNDLKIILRRNLSGRGVYDGLDIPIEEGDYAVGVYTAGQMYYETIYYSRDNELKGRYFNINTPLFFHSDGIHYYDLEIDVIEPLNRPREIIDKDLLDKALELEILTEGAYKSAMDVANSISSGDIPSELDQPESDKGPEDGIDEEEEEEEDD